MESGYEFRLGTQSIDIAAPLQYGPERELRISVFPDDHGVPYFWSVNLEWYCAVKRDDKLSEAQIIEYLGEFYGKTISGVTAHKARITAEAAAHQEYLASEQRKRDAAEAAESFKKALKWIAVGVVIVIVFAAFR